MSLNIGSSFTKTIHHDTYAAISPLRPELSQATKTVLITGGATGIGFATARAFAQAGATTIIIASRREDVIKKSAVNLSTEFAASNVKVIGLCCDVTNTDETNKLWDTLHRDGIVVDVLVLNAGQSSVAKSILDIELDTVWNSFLTNVRGHMHFSQKLYSQKGRNSSQPLAIVNVSTISAHEWGFSYDLYGLTKNAGTLAMQQIAKSTSPDIMQVVSYHPGVVYTDIIKNLNYKKEDFAWDEDDLAAHFTVWASSSEAAFLHGRFVWAAWDVDELKTGAIRERIDSDPDFLRVGIQGLAQDPRVVQSLAK
ncbi:NAD(P)-binding protein [Xylariaceae sp. FL0255]|nr:NAD(P)-binding protein [Xylariaceae sp. FL0255]